MAIVELPTEKSERTLTASTAKVLLYGPPKIGKSTLAVSVRSDFSVGSSTMATSPPYVMLLAEAADLNRDLEP